MSWGFRQTGQTHCNKTALQLMQEASAVMMLGGAYQTYIMQRRDTSPKVNCALNLVPLAKYCREREPFCKGIKNIPEVTIYNSTIDHYAEIPYPFSNGKAYDSIKGITKLLARGGFSFDIREEHNLFNCIDDFKCVVVPEVNSHFGQNDVEVLSCYAENGGCLVLNGIKTLNAFKDRLRLTLGEVSKKNITNLTLGDGFWSATSLQNCSVEGDKILAYSSAREDGDECRYPIAAMKNIGKGKVVLIGTDLGGASNTNMTVTARKIYEKIFDYFTPVARIEGSRYCNINVAEKNGKTLVHLFNISGEHNNEIIDNFDEILPLYNLTLTLNLNKAPKKAIWQPDGSELKITENGGKFSIKLPPLHIHNIVELEF